MLSKIKILFKKGEIKNGIFSIVNSCLELFGASCSCENSVLLGTVFTILSGCIHFSSITNRYVLRQSSIYLQISNKLESLSLTFFFASHAFQHLRIPNHARSQLLHRTHISGWPRKPWENGFPTVKECIISVTQDILKLASPFNVAVKGNGCLLNLCLLV